MRVRKAQAQSWNLVAGLASVASESSGVQEAVCPRCQLKMLTTIFREWSVSLCPRCEATFYDETVLETLLRQPDLRLSYLRPALLPNLSAPHPAEDDRGRISCPTCQAEMVREGYSPDNPMLVDRCPDCHGIWLDDGELGHLVSEWENSHHHAEPGFWEGLRRLLGMSPRIVIDEESIPESTAAQDSP